MATAIGDLIEERATLVESMRSILDTADSEKRELTAEDRAEYDKQEERVTVLEGDIRRNESAKRAENADVREIVEDAVPDPATATAPLARAAGLWARMTVGGSEKAATELREMAVKHDTAELRSRAIKGDTNARRVYLATDEYRDAFETYLRTLNGAVANPEVSLGAEQRAALTVGTGTTGGYTVPVEFYNQLIVRLREFGVVRKLATVITTAGSGDLQIPRVGATRASAAWTAEAAAYTESEDVFEQVILKSYKEGLTAKASEEIIHDSAFDVLAWVATSSGEALGILENTAFQTGASGSTTTPEGLLTKATIGVTLATGQTTTITSADSLFDLYHSVLPPYRARGSWVFNDATIKTIRKLKTTQNEYIWNESLIEGQPDMLLGRPVYTDPDVPVAAANALTGLFGDVKAAYMIRDVEGLTAQVLNELYANTGQVGYRIHKRTDGDIVDDIAVKTLKQSAT